MLFVPWVTQAQTLEDYSFLTGVDTTKWIDMSSATQILTPANSDGMASTVQNIGFSFPFRGNTYTQYSVNTDGNLRLGPTATSTSYYSSPFSSTNSNQNNPKINAFGCDGYGVSSTHYVKALDTVDASNDTMLVVEFCMGTYTSSTRNQLYKWQVHLYTNGNIDIVYGPTPTTAPGVTRQPGICFNSSDGWVINANNTASHFTSGYSSTTFPSGQWPTNGRYYSFQTPNLLCPKPTGITVDNLSTTSFDISWTDTSSATSWIVQLISNDSVYYDNVEYAFPVYFTGLNPATQYTVYVAGLCSNGDTSDFLTLDVFTYCDPLTSLPYIQNFDGVPGSTTTSMQTNNLPPCWNYLNHGTRTDYKGYPIVYNSSEFAHSGSNSMRFYSYYSAADSSQYAILPMTDSTLFPINNLMVNFNMRVYFSGSSYTAYAIVGIMTNPTDASTFVPIDTLISNTTTYSNFEAYLSSYTGPHGYVTLLFPQATLAGADYNFGYVDDVVLNVIPTCPPIHDLTQTDASLSSVTVSWTEMGSATQWVVEYDTVDFVPGTGSGNIDYATATTHTISNLDSAHTYYIYVHADCGGGDTSANSFITANTLASSPASLPYLCDFEGDGNNGWQLLNGNQTNAWNVGSATNNGGSKSLYISDNGGTSNSYNISSISYTYAYRTLDITDSGEFAYSYDWKGQGESHTYDFTRVFLTPSAYQWQENSNPAGSTYAFSSWNCPADWIELTEQFSSPATLSRSSTWRTASGTFRINNPGTYNIVFAWANDGSVGTQPPTAIDNIEIIQNSCPAPNVSVNSITSDTIALEWTPGGNETSWLVSLDSFAIEVYDTSYIFESLTPNTEYDIEVRAICGPGDTSLAVPINVRTACGPFALPFYEDFDSWSSSAADPLPACWYKKTNYSTNYPYASTSQNHTPGGSKSMYMYSTASTWSYMVLPQFAAPLSSLQIHFWLRKASASHRLFVGVITDPNDETTFQAIDTVSPSALSVWEEFVIPFSNYTGPAQYIAIMSPNGESSYPYLDDLTVDMVPDCPAVDNLIASNITQNSADLSWTETGTATSWTVEYLPTGAPADSAVTIYANDTTVSLTGLATNTEYTVIVTVECSTGLGGSSMITFRTECGSITSLPYTYGFEDAETGSSTSSAFAPCLKRLNNGSTYFGYPYVGSSTYNHTPGGMHGLYWYNSITATTYGDYQIVVLPPVDTTIYPINTLQLSFWSRSSSTSYSPVFEVGIMTDPFDASTFTPVDTIHVGNNTSWNEFSAIFGSFTGYGQYVALRATRPVSSWYAYVDDFTLEEAPTCPEIENLTVQATASHARVTWSYSRLLGVVPANFIVSYGFASDSLVGATTITTSDTSIILNGLIPDTTYTISVSAQCTSSNGLALQHNFNTRALPCLVWDTSSSGPMVPYVVGNPTTTNNTNVMPVNGSYNYSYCNHLIRHSEINITGPSYISGIDFQYADASPMTSKTNCTIYMCHTSLTTCSQFANPADLVLVYEGPLNCTNTGWNHFDFNRGNFSYDGVSNMIVAIVDNSGATESNGHFYYETPGDAVSHRVYRNDAPYSFADLGTVTANNSMWRTNMRLTTGGLNCLVSASCTAPDVIIDSVETNAAYLSWIPGYNESSWNIEYRPTGATTWITADTGVTTQNYTITGLNANTHYQVRVGSSCSDTIYYDMTSFTTACGTITSIPWSDNLDYYTTGSSSTNSPFINCWHHLNNGTSYGGYPYVGGSTYNHTPGGQHGLYWYNTTTAGSYGDYQCIVFPEIDNTISIDSLQLSFWTRASSSSYTPVFQVGVMTDPTDITTFVSMATVTVTSGTTWELVEVPLGAYTDSGHFIAVKADRSTATWYAYVDDFTIERMPTCIPPQNIHATNTSTTSLTIDWTDVTPAMSWNIEYGPAGFTPGSSAGTSLSTFTHPVTINGLDTLSLYDFYIQSICSVGDTSRWSNVTTLATTMCDNSTAAIIGSETSTGTAYQYPVNNFYRYTLSETIIDSAEINGPMDIEYIGYYYNYATPSTDKVNCTIYFQPTTKTTFSGTTDVVALDSSAVKVYTGHLNCSQGWNFFHLDTTYQYDGTGNLMVIVDDNSNDYNSSSYTFKTEPCSGNKTLHYYSDSQNPDVTNPSSFTGSKGVATSRVVMQLLSCSAPACPQPNIVSAAQTYHSATVTWTGNGNDYEVNIKESAAPDWPAAGVTVSGNSFTFTGLLPATAYTFRVRQDCNADSLGYSDWTVSGFVTDSLPCLTPDSLHATAVTNATADLDWNVYGNESNWDIHVWYSGGFDSTYRVSSRPATIGGFTAGVTYYASIRALCGVNLVEGDWSDTVSFTTAVCPDVTGLSAGYATANSITLSWANNPMAQSWIIEYGLSGFPQGSGITATSTTNNYVVNGLTDETLYDFHVRAVCGPDWYSEGWASVTASTLSGGVTCDAPTNVTATVADNSVTVNWTAGQGNLSFELEYGPHGFAHGSGIVVTATTSPIVISNLDYETQYDVYVHAICDRNTVSPWSTPATFTTGQRPSEDCNPVQNLAVSNITDNSADVNWTPGDPDDSNWQIVVTDERGNDVLDTRSTETRAALSGLTPGTNYTVKVRTVCDEDNFSAFVSANFRTTGGIGIDDVTTASCSIYPNPASGSTTISVAGVNGLVKIAVVDMNGRTVASETLECSSDCVKTMDVEKLAQGAYFVRITGQDVNMVRKLIVK